MQTRVTLWFKGVLWILAGLLLFLAGGTADFGVLRILGVPAALYGVVLIVQDRMVRKRVEFTAEELERWGERLSAGTPEILQMLEEGATLHEVGRAMERDRGLPPEMTLRYIVALGGYQKEQQANR